MDRTREEIEAGKSAAAKDRRASTGDGSPAEEVKAPRRRLAPSIELIASAGSQDAACCGDACELPANSSAGAEGR